MARNLTAAPRFCPGYHISMEMLKMIISFIVEPLLDEYDAHVEECADNYLQVQHLYGEKLYDDWNDCYNAIAEIDAYSGKGVGCEIHEKICCHTCNVIVSGDYADRNYINILRIP
eukprot:UN02940